MAIMRDLRISVLRPNGTTTPQQPPAVRSGLIDCGVYQDGKRLAEEFTVESALEHVRTDRSGGFVWIGLHEPGDAELSRIADLFDLHELAVEDAMYAAHQRPKLDRYDDMLFVVLKTVRYVEHAKLTPTSEVVETGEIMVFLGKDFVITVRHGDHGDLRALRRRLEADPEPLALGPSAVLHAVADRVVDDYLLVCEALQDDIDDVEIQVFTARRSRDAERIYQLKREVLELKRAVTPLGAPLRVLAERPMRLIDPEIRDYFRDVDDHLSRVSEQVSSFDELLTTIIQANVALVGVAQNEDMRKITSWAAIFAVPTMIAGIYGMNFSYMPELDWRYGYPFVLGVILVTCFLLYRGFRRNGWL